MMEDTDAFDSWQSWLQICLRELDFGPVEMEDSEARLEAARLALHACQKTDWPAELRRGYMHAALVYALVRVKEKTEDAARTILHALDKIILLAGLPACQKGVHVIIQAIQDWLYAKHPPPHLSASRRQRLLSLKVDAQERNVFRRYKTPPSLMAFKRDHMDTGMPCVMEGALNSWPALRERSWEDLEQVLFRIGRDRLVPVEIGGKYTDEDWTQTLMPLGEFIKKFIEPETPAVPLGYIAQHALHEQAPALGTQYFIPDYCALHPDQKIAQHFWLGPSGTVSPPHTDPQENLFAQVVGVKEVLLWAPEAPMYPFPYGSMLSNTSQVADPYAVDNDAFPDFSMDKAMHFIVKPGDLLYIPRGWWHYVRSLSVSVSISFWFGPSAPEKQRPEAETRRTSIEID